MFRRIRGICIYTYTPYLPKKHTIPQKTNSDMQKGIYLKVKRNDK